MSSHADTFEALYQASGGSEGAAWYAVARSTARKFARTYDVTLNQSAGVIAAMSPNSSWRTNVMIAERIISTFVADRSADAPTSGYGLGANVRKSWRILQGERCLKVFRTSPKVEAFYRAILGDDRRAVIDRWMMRAAGFDHDAPTRAEYALLSAALAEAAVRQGVPTTVLQAVVWAHVRGAAT